MSTSERVRPSTFFSVMGWLVTLTTPVVLVLTAVRALLFPWILTLEYNTPGFPPDPYGFSKQDRLYWAGISLEFLKNNAGVSFVADLRFPDGTQVYNERELSHFMDAKNVIRGALKTWDVSLGLLILLGLWAWLGGWWETFKHGLGRGGWLTVFLIVAVLAFAIFGFGVFFVAFHEVFFPPGTWMFYYSDTFIRLFPERFWRDMFVYIGVIAIGSSLLVIFLTGGFARGDNEKSARQQE